MRLDSPFHTTYAPLDGAPRAVARRSILARALRADVVTPKLGVVLLWGEPRIGKSTLVRQVLWSLEPDSFVATRVPIGALAETLPGQCRAGGILESQIAVQLGAPAASAASPGFGPALDRCLEVARHSRRTLVVALEGVDRYARGVWPGGVQQNLGLLRARVPELSLVLTSRLPLARLDGIEVPEHVRVHFVPPLERDEAQRLLTGPARGWLEYTPEALDELLGAAGGRPLLIQIAGRNCTRLARDTSRPTIGLEEAREMLASCWLAGEVLFRPLLGGLTPVAQRIVWATAQAAARGAATIEQVYETAGDAGVELSPAAFGNEVSMLRLWRLVDVDADGRHRLACGWLARYLTAA